MVIIMGSRLRDSRKGRARPRDICRADPVLQTREALLGGGGSLPGHQMNSPDPDQNVVIALYVRNVILPLLPNFHQ